MVMVSFNPVRTNASFDNLTKCSACGAVVTQSDQQRHRTWHRKLEASS